MARRRLPALLIALVLTVAAAAGALSLPVSADPTGFMPREEPGVGEWLEITRRFGSLDMLTIGLEEPAEPFSPAGLGRLAAVTRALEGLKADGVLFVRSLANVPAVSEGADGSVLTEPLMPVPPVAPEGVEALRARLLADPNTPGSLVSHDLSGYFILVRTDPRRDQREVARQVQAAVEAERGQLAAFYFGAPFYSNLITSRLYAQLPWIAPLFVLGLLIVLLPVVRRPSPAGVVIAGALLPLVWWLGLMRLFGLGLSYTSLNASLVVLAAGLAAAGRGVAPGAGPAERRLTLRLLAAGAAGAAALSLVPASYLAPFGLASAIGLVAVGLAQPLVIAPLAGRTAEEERPAAGAGWLPPALPGLAFLLACVAGLPFAWEMRFLVSPREIFGPAGEVGTALDFFDRRFGGADYLQVRVAADLRDPRAAARLMRYTDLLEGSDRFGDVRSVSQVLGFLSRQFGGLHRIPTDREALANLWFFLEGSEDARPMVVEGRDEALIAARIIDGGQAGGRDWVAEAERLAVLSAGDGHQLARERLLALGRRHRVALDPDRLDALVRDGRARQGAADPGAAGERALAGLSAYLNGPDGPFVPSQDEWREVSRLLSSPGGASPDELASAVAGMSGFRAAGLPEGAERDVAAMLVTRYRDVEIGHAAGRLAGELLAGVTTHLHAGPFADRVTGVFADLLDPVDGGPDRFEVTVSGLPAVARAMEGRLLRSTFSAAVLVWAAALLLSAAALRRPRQTLHAALAVGAAQAALFACGSLSGLHADPSSATLYLIPGLIGWLFYPWDGRRPSAALAAGAGLALACLSLLLAGPLPMTRLGLVLFFALVLPVAAAVTAAPRPVVPGARTGG